MSISSVAAAQQKSLRPTEVMDIRKVELNTPDAMRSHAVSSMKKAPVAFSPEDIITSVEGEVQDIQITGSGYAVFMGSLYTYEDETVSSHYVSGENGEIYIYDLIPNCPAGSYVKGVKTGDKIVIDFPQTVYWFSGEEYGLYMTTFDMVYFEDENGEPDAWYYKSDDTSISFTVAEDGTWSADGLNFDKILGVANTDDDSWGGYGAWSIDVTPFDDKPVTVPSGLEVSENYWVIPLEGYGRFVNFAQDGDEVYLQGLSGRLPEAWVKGSVDRSGSVPTVSIAQNQYLGTLNGYFTYTKCAKWYYDDFGYIECDLLPEDYNYELVWDAEKGTLVSKDPEVALLVNYTKADIADWAETLAGLDMEHFDSFEGTPVNPSGLRFADFLAEEGYLQFFFDLPAMSTDSGFLVTDDLYYVVYVDGEQWTFDAEEYEIPETLEEIPWNLDEYWICKLWDSEIGREVDFFVEGITTLGVQSVYKYNGKETRSEIMTIDLDDPSSVADINVGKKVSEVKYYDITGREVSDPEAGLVIKRVIYGDGSVDSFKKMVR